MEFRLVLFVLAFSMAGLLLVHAETAQDECTGPLANLLSCLSYVQGKSLTPSADCCPNLLNVYKLHPKCLCVLIQSSTQGGIQGLPPVNQTLALRLPVACKVPADPKLCPGLLGISPSSPAAKIFETPSAGAATSAATSTKTPSPANTTSSAAAVKHTTSGGSPCVLSFWLATVAVGAFVAIVGHAS
eukprot:c14339_g1_i3 orf=504-1064(-)